MKIVCFENSFIIYLSLLIKFENKNYLDIIYKYWEIIDFKEFS